MPLALTGVALAVWGPPGSGVVLAALALGLAFGVLRAATLALAARVCARPLSLPSAWRLFLEGACIEALSWPGKLWADAYRIAALGRPRHAAISALLVWRAASVLGTLSVLAAVGGTALAGTHPPTTLLGAVAIATVLLLAQRDRRLVQQTGSIAMLTPLAGAATLCDVLAAVTLAWGLAGADPVWFAGAYCGLAAVSAASSLPLGIGILDLGLWSLLVLHTGATPAGAAIVVGAYRLTGPVTTLALGAVSLAARPSGRRGLGNTTQPLRPSVRNPPTPIRLHTPPGTADAPQNHAA